MTHELSDWKNHPDTDIDRRPIAAMLNIGRKLGANNDAQALALGAVAIPALRQAIQTAQRMQEAAQRAAQHLHSAQTAFAWHLPTIHRHPRKGDRHPWTGKVLQGKRYRQACREWNRNQRMSEHSLPS